MENDLLKLRDMLKEAENNINLGLDQIANLNIRQARIILKGIPAENHLNKH